MILTLSPKFRMRKENGFVCLYGVDENMNFRDFILNPIEAIIISLFDGNNSREDVINIFSYITDNNEKISRDMVDDVLKKYGQFFVEANGITNHYNPADFIYNKEDINTNFPFQLKAPNHFVWLLTNTCRADCIYCYAQRKKTKNDLLSLDRIFQIIDEAAQIGVCFIALSGGDPLLHKNIFDILRYMHENNIYFYISTKTHITSEIAFKLKQVGTELVQLSIDSLNNNTSEKLVNVSNYATEMIDSIMNLINNDIKVRIKSVITSININDVEDLINGLIKLNVNNLDLTAYMKSLYRHNDDLFLSEEDCEFIDQLTDKYKGLINVSFYKVQKPIKPTKCSGGYSSFVVHPDGKVTLCEEMPAEDPFIIGDLKYQSIMDVWQSDKLIEFKVPSRDKYKGSICYDCLDFFECHVAIGKCFLNSLKAYGNIYAPSPLCRYISEVPRLS